MEQKKILAIVVHFPNGHPSLSLGTIDTAEEFDDFVEFWQLEEESIARSWADVSSADADALEGLLEDRSKSFYEDENPMWELYRDCEFLVRLL